MRSPSATLAPLATASEPRCVSVTESPSAVRIETLCPLDGTEPANVTSPPAGARTTVPDGEPMSIPRCSPAAYGCAGSKENPDRTGPVTGHVHAPAEGTATTNSTTTITSARTTTPFCCQICQREQRRLAGASAVVNPDYSEPR
jgi:hypothetical protein